MHILLGLTGSVASTIAPKIVSAMEEVINCRSVKVIMTDKAQMFFSADSLRKQSQVDVYTERDEWVWTKQSIGVINGNGFDHGISRCTTDIETDKWEKGFPILHVELAKKSSALVIAPASANTIAKIANGICDNLLTSVYAAWIKSRPIIVCPAMNTHMWESNAVQTNIEKLKAAGVIIIDPVCKPLACGDVGTGALADVKHIASVVSEYLRWDFPFDNDVCKAIPIGNHPGSFGAIRKYDRHNGVDLYCKKGTSVRAVEDGIVVSVEDFTGPNANCGWWLPTKAVRIEGASGTICYGEIELQERSKIQVGNHIKRGDYIGYVIPVLPKEKLRKDIPFHSCSMLHIQLYEHGMLHCEKTWETEDKNVPDGVLDPTKYILESVIRGWDYDFLKNSNVSYNELLEERSVVKDIIPTTDIPKI